MKSQPKHPPGKPLPSLASPDAAPQAPRAAEQSPPPADGSAYLAVALGAACFLLLACFAAYKAGLLGGGSSSQVVYSAPVATQPAPKRSVDPLAATPAGLPTRPQPLQVDEALVYWNVMPPEIASADPTRSSYSNIAPADYVKPAGCAHCHPEQHKRWLSHPHSKMNADIGPETNLGRFDGSVLSLHGGRITMFREGDDCFIRTEKDDVDRTYRVTRTIGSRFLQFYVGIFHSGTPLPPDDASEFRLRGAARPELVMPVGYWLTRERWIPGYDVYDYIDREDVETEFDVYHNPKPIYYYQHCADCHTTLPEGYRIFANKVFIGPNKPVLHLGLWDFLKATAGDAGVPTNTQPPLTTEAIQQLLTDVVEHRHPGHGVVELGITCESCHLGGREHAQSGGKVQPRFLPSSPHLAQEERVASQLGRTVDNINASCARCHAAYRVPMAGGFSHKNSSEYLDAVNGACYSQLKCTDCHDPHTATGRVWPKTPAQDDQSCLRCHDHQPGFRSEEEIAAHTHHPFASSGSRCMNCHMPKITEGLENVVRTHRIASPTQAEVIEKGGLNACNLCHLDQPITWTLDKLSNWYGARIDREQAVAAHGGEEHPTGLAYLSSKTPYVRYGALGAVQNNHALPLAGAAAQELDSPRLIHRQLAQDCLESLLNTDLGRSAGYQFWLTPVERVEPLARVRELIKLRQQPQPPRFDESESSPTPTPAP